MTTLGLLVEGGTEREFVTRLIKPHLHERGVFTKPIDLEGNISLDRLRHHLPRALGDFDHVSTLVDYYGFKRRGAMSVEQLEAAIAGSINSDRFIPYVQKHEFEALLFADPVSLAHTMGQPNQRQRLEQLVIQAGGAESINDGNMTCPSRRLESIFPTFDKKLHGPEICHRAGLARIRLGCQRFHEWLARLEGLQGQ